MEALGRDRHARAMLAADRIITRVAARVGRKPYELTGGRADPASSLTALEDLQTQVGDHESLRARLSLDELACLHAAVADLAGLERARMARGIRALDQVLAACHRAADVASLADEAAIHATRLGFRRALFSWVRAGRWIPRSAQVGDDPMGGAPYLAAGVASDAEVHSFVEERALRTGTTILISDAATNPGVNKKLHRINAATAYIAAPVMSGGEVRGLVHVADHVTSATVDVNDVPVVAAYARGLGTAFELAALREHVRGQGSSDEAELAARFGDGGPSGAPAPGLSSLSAREHEVLVLLSQGLTNPQIADRLVVSSETVKTHVRHVLHKLGADTRTHAATIYQLGTARGSWMH